MTTREKEIDQSINNKKRTTMEGLQKIINMLTQRFRPVFIFYFFTKLRFLWLLPLLDNPTRSHLPM